MAGDPVIQAGYNIDIDYNIDIVAPPEYMTGDL